VSKLLKKAKDLGSKAAVAAKKEVKKLLPPETLSYIVFKVDTLSLNRAVKESKSLLRGLRAQADVKMDETLKGMMRRMKNVIRTGGNAVRDMTALAEDPTNLASPADKAALASRLQAFKTNGSQLADSAARILRTLRKEMAQAGNAKMRSLLVVYQARSRQIEAMLTELDQSFKKVSGEEVKDDEA
jgi:hypothetical protein